MTRRGFTLLELIVTLAILGLGFAVAGVALRGTPPETSGEVSAGAVVNEARRMAFLQGLPVTVVAPSADRYVMVTAMPDGRLLGGEALGLSQLHGGPRPLSRPEQGASTDAEVADRGAR